MTPTSPKGMEVRVYGSGVAAVDKALRSLKRKLAREGNGKDLVQRSRGYLKPSERKRLKRANAARRRHKAEIRQREYEARNHGKVWNR